MFISVERGLSNLTELDVIFNLKANGCDLIKRFLKYYSTSRIVQNI
jgi:hypothetical protein